MKQMKFETAVGLLKKHGVKTASFAVVRNEKSALAAAEKLGWPVVLKGLSPDVIHKTEVGVVFVNNKSVEDVRKAYDKIVVNLKKRRARFQGVLVQEQAEGFEVIIGAKRDSQFGPVVLFGLGGIFTEVLKDYSLRVAPVSEKEALDMIKETKAFAVLAGARGQKPANLRALARTISGVSKLVFKNEKVRELDLNPCFASPRDCVAADVRVIV